MRWAELRIYAKQAVNDQANTNFRGAHFAALGALPRGQRILIASRTGLSSARVKKSSGRVKAEARVKNCAYFNRVSEQGAHAIVVLVEG